MSTTGEFFSEQLIKVTNPFTEFGIFRLVVGGIYVIWGGSVLLSSADLVRGLIEQIDSGGDFENGSPWVFMRMVLILVALFVVFRGLGMLMQGIRSLQRLLIPVRAPADLSSEELETSLQRREMKAYSDGSSMGSYGIVRRWLPSRFPIMTTSMRDFAEDGLSGIRAFLFVMFILIAAFVTVSFLPEEMIQPVAAVLPQFPWLFALLYLCVCAFRVAFVFQVLPDATPKADVIEFRAGIRGGGDPNLIPHGLEHDLAVIRPDVGTPNRSTVVGFEMNEGGVEDTGQFEGVLTIENQPEFVKIETESSMTWLLAMGSICQVLFLFWLFHIPTFAQDPFPDDTTGGILLGRWGLHLIGGFLLLAGGGKMIRQASGRLGTFRFTSLAVALSVRGNYGKSKVRVGKARDDSIESENLVVRSDCSVTGHAAVILTESFGLKGRREVIGMLVDDDKARKVEGIVTGWLSKFE